MLSHNLNHQLLKDVFFLSVAGSPCVYIYTHIFILIFFIYFIDFQITSIFWVAYAFINRVVWLWVHHLCWISGATFTDCFPEAWQSSLRGWVGVNWHFILQHRDVAMLPCFNLFFHFLKPHWWHIKLQTLSILAVVLKALQDVSSLFTQSHATQRPVDTSHFWPSLFNKKETSTGRRRHSTLEHKMTRWT